MSPTVRIDGDRKYVDYFTFKSFDVEKDVDAVLDLGNHSTDLIGYLIDKGYSVYNPIDVSAIWLYLNSDEYIYNITIISTIFNVSGAGITASGMPYVLDKDF